MEYRFLESDACILPDNGLDSLKVMQLTTNFQTYSDILITSCIFLTADHLNDFDIKGRQRVFRFFESFDIIFLTETHMFRPIPHLVHYNAT